MPASASARSQKDSDRAQCQRAPQYAHRMIHTRLNASESLNYAHRISHTRLNASKRLNHSHRMAHTRLEASERLPYARRIFTQGSMPASDSITLHRVVRTRLEASERLKLRSQNDLDKAQCAQAGITHNCAGRCAERAALG